MNDGNALLGATIEGAVRPRSFGNPGARPEGADQFDFLWGFWNVHHRKLRERLTDCTQWDEFAGTLDVEPILAGLGNVDQNVMCDPLGTHLASSIRIFDANSASWSIYWMDGRRSGLDKPVVGNFAGTTGSFYNRDQFQGRPIDVRFVYRNLAPGRASWEQAFSIDEGKTWETNWTMGFTRPDARP